MSRLDHALGFHSDTVGAIMKARYARFDSPLPCDQELNELMERDGYVLHGVVREFDQRYGGLVVAAESTCFDGTPVGPDWAIDSAPLLVFGAAWCARSGFHGPSHGGDLFLKEYGGAHQLVPVAYGPQDDIYYLDAVGRGYLHDTCYDVGGPHLIANTPAQLVARLILNAWCFSVPQNTKVKGKQSIAVAHALGLSLLEDASGEMGQWWGDGCTVVGESVSFPHGGSEPVHWETFGATDDADRMQAILAAMHRT